MASKPLIYIGADHAGFSLKEELKQALTADGYEVQDVGAEAFVDTDDYPAYAERVAKAVAADSSARGLLACGNAEGVCIAANKVRGTRAAVGFSIEAAKTSRTDDDANVLCLPGRIETNDSAIEMVRAFLTTPFSGAERHERRLKQVEEMEEQNV